MKETVNSIKWYLLLVGTIGGLVQLIVTLEPTTPLLGKVIGGAGFLVALGYIYGGASAKDLIAKNPQRLVAVLVIGGVYTIVTMLFAFIFSGADNPNPTVKAALSAATRATLIRSGIGLAITAYLLVNVNRLAKEAHETKSGTDDEFDDLDDAPPAPAPVQRRPAGQPQANRAAPQQPAKPAIPPPLSQVKRDATSKPVLGKPGQAQRPSTGSKPAGQ